MFGAKYVFALLLVILLFMQSHLGWMPGSLDFLYSPASYNLFFSPPLYSPVLWSLSSSLKVVLPAGCVWGGNSGSLWTTISTIFYNGSSFRMEYLQDKLSLSLFNAFHRIPSLKDSTFSRVKEKRNKKMRNTKISLLLQLKEIS